MWPWTAKINFNQPVTIEIFEELMASAPIMLAKTSDLQSVILEIQDSAYEHPPHQQPALGTRAVVRFLARLGPV